MQDSVNKPCIRHVLIPTPISKALKRISLTLALWAFTVWVSLAAVPTMAVDDDYLKALESEADDTGTLTTKQNTNPGKSANPGGVKNSTKKNFEQLLEFELPSTYKFYTKLNAEDQAKVIKRYNKEKKLSAASKIIFDLYFARNK
jgi:hypothetical protein